MTIRTMLAAATLIAPIALAQEGAPEPAKNAAHEEAIGLLRNVHETYKAAAAIDEEIVLEFEIAPGVVETQTITLQVGSKTGEMSIEDQLTFTWLDGNVYLTSPMAEGGYVVAESTSFSAGVNDMMDGMGGMPGLWTLALRESDDPATWLASFAMGDVSAEVTEVEHIHGEEHLHVVHMKGTMANVAVTVDSANLIRSVVMSMDQPGSDDTFTMPFADKIRIVDAQPAVSFDAGERTKYDSMDAFFASTMGGMEEEPEPEVELAGKAAPDFTLKQMGGGEVTLSALKGEVVVLDFWATWCGPCRRGLPALNEFAAWAKEEGLPVRIYAVNIWEGDSVEDSLKKVEPFWSEAKYHVPVLLGSGDEKLPESYGIRGIPTTIIVAADGTVFEKHVGYSDQYFDSLKESVRKAMGEG